MRPQLTQKELQDYIENGKPYIWQYATLYTIDYSLNVGNGEYYLRQIGKATRGNVTQRGRFIAMNAIEAMKYR